MSWWNNWYVSFLSWRVRHIKERNFIVILSLLVGIITGLAGVFLKNSVHYTHQFLTERLQIDSGSFVVFYSSFYRDLVDLPVCSLFCERRYQSWSDKGIICDFPA